MSTEANKEDNSLSKVKSGEPVRGKPVSGRNWKGVKTQRTSTLIKSKPKRKTWEEKTADRKKRESMKDFERQLKEEQEAERQRDIERIKENRKRRVENENKSVQYQVITDTNKIKKMSKKQMRHVRRLADVNK
jgi:rRNA-processing protein CGR1